MVSTASGVGKPGAETELIVTVFRVSESQLPRKRVLFRDKPSLNSSKVADAAFFSALIPGTLKRHFGR